MKTQHAKIVSIELALLSSAISQTSAAGFVEVSPMNLKRGYHTATLLPNGKVLVAGGRQAGPDTGTSAELYDPATDTWTLTGRMRSPIGYAYHTATLLPNGKVLIAGGNGLVSTAELYDPATEQWTLTGSLKTQRSLHKATLLPDGKVLVTGGGVSYGELYDPASGTWTATGSGGAGYPTATLLPNGKVLAASASAELYDPATGMWTTTGTPGGYHFTATLLLNGKVLLAAGAARTVPAELYDPDSGTWSATGSLTWERVASTATLLRNGQVLVAGGLSNTTNGGSLSSAELYDPTTATWTEIPMNADRDAHTATLLPNGKVLVAGGIDSGNFNLSSAEIYEPDSDGATPSITVLHSANRIMSFSWSSVGTLEQSDSLITPNWQPAPNQANPQTLTTTAAMKFFRVKAD